MLSKRWLENQIISDVRMGTIEINRVGNVGVH